MKTRLNQLSMAAFIELSCGHTSVLLEDGEQTDKAVLEHVKSELIAEYMSITNPASMKSMLIDREDDSKLTAKILMLGICLNLCNLGDYDLARSAMKEYEPGYSKDDKSMYDDIKRRLRDAEFAKKRISSSKEPYVPPTEKETRDYFDKEIATLMTFVKMPIDIHVTSAAVYANIVNQVIESAKRRKRG